MTPGLVLVFGAVAVAMAVSHAVPVVSALIVAMVLGVLVANLPIERFMPGVRWSNRRMLRAGVVLLGLQLAVPDILGLGFGTIAAVVVTVAVGFGGTVLLGQLLGVSRGMSLLVATGCSICGASAIAAVEGVVRRREEDVAAAVALVTLYGGLAIAAIPLVGRALGFDAGRVGAWAGISVHEVAQAMAAASPAGEAAVATAAVVKLCRVVLLAPIVAGVSMVERRSGAARVPLVPLFVLGFLVMVAVRSTGWIPESVLTASRSLTTLLLAGALFGLGCSVRVSALVRTGGRALLLGLLSSVLVAGVGCTTLVLFG